MALGLIRALHELDAKEPARRLLDLFVKHHPDIDSLYFPDLKQLIEQTRAQTDVEPDVVRDTVDLIKNYFSALQNMSSEDLLNLLYGPFSSPNDKKTSHRIAHRRGKNTNKLNRNQKSMKKKKK